MKSKIIFSLIMTMSLSFATIPVYVLNSKVVSSAPIKGIVNNKIKFEVVNNEDAPQSLVDLINKMKDEKGFIYTVDDSSGYIYIAVMNGEKPTGGYSIEVKGIEDNEGRTNVFVNELTPWKSMYVTQAITYPYVIVRAKGITENITVINLENEYFSNLTMKKQNTK